MINFEDISKFFFDIIITIILLIDKIHTFIYRQLLSRHILKYRQELLHMDSMIDRLEEILQDVTKEIDTGKRINPTKDTELTELHDKKKLSTIDCEDESSNNNNKLSSECNVELQTPIVNPNHNDNQEHYTSSQQPKHPMTMQCNVFLSKHCKATLSTYQQRSNYLSRIVEQLESVRDILDIENESKPFTIFGMEATSSMTMSIITSFVSLLGLLISIFSSNASLSNISSSGL
jgi:hypothetical protein